MTSSADGAVLLELAEPDGDRSVVIEDDGRVAYAYLLQGGVLVSDVWLYNVAPAPETVDRSQMFVRGERLARLEPAVKPGWSRAAARPGPLARPLDPA